MSGPPPVEAEGFPFPSPIPLTDGLCSDGNNFNPDDLPLGTFSGGFQESPTM